VCDLGDIDSSSSGDIKPRIIRSTLSLARILRLELGVESKAWKRNMSKLFRLNRLVHIKVCVTIQHTRLFCVRYFLGLL
jgi:hypothetical protein